MLLRWATVTSLLFLAVSLPRVYASPAPHVELPDRRSLQHAGILIRRGGHDHDHRNADAAPLLTLNETEVTMYHSPTPPSYYTIDWEDEGYQHRHGGLMIVHGIFMSIAFFGALPVGVALRSVKHPAHGLATFAFYSCCALGCAASGLYRKLTPNMYEGAVHIKQGYIVILVAISLSALDIIAMIRRIINFLRSPVKNSRTFWRYVIMEEAPLQSGPEYSGIITEEPEDDNSSPRPSIELQFVPNPRENSTRNQTERWANAVHHHQRYSSMNSEGTLINSHAQTPSPDTSLNVKSRRDPLATLTGSSRLDQIGVGLFAVVERSLLVAGFMQLLLGIITYTGGCRENYQNGCLAHLIKGGIFWCYGLLTFARFLGLFSDLGWAWNRSTSGDNYSAEFVESFVIFFYGATNTWMERFGANPGDPFTTKEIQHISIAVMFCFAGLVGMGIESKRIREWLASLTSGSSAAVSEMSQEGIVQPVSYMGSFNPFPALVIGVTGAAMAAHAQTYLFQVQIHALWGNLLVAFSVLRCLTYFFLWLSPPRSILPSRPPTEALGSFFLACGGLVFMFSTEEMTIAAMRRGRDNAMMFLNVAVAITCLAFCWTLSVVGFKGWMKSRTQPAVPYLRPE